MQDVDKSISMESTPASIPPEVLAPQISTLRYDLAPSLTQEEEEQMLVDMDSNIAADLVSLDSDDDFPSDIESTDDHEKLIQDDESPPHYNLFEDINDAGSNINDKIANPSLSGLDWESAQPVKTDGPLIQTTSMAHPSRRPRASGLGSSSLVRAGQDLCVVCGLRPAYSDDRHSFPTCSKTCGIQLQSFKGLPNQSANRGSSGYDLKNVSKAIWESRNSSFGSNLHRRSTPTLTTNKMCVVCHTRRQHVRAGVVYPTCGLTCASKLAGSQGIGMCTFCHQRPKVVTRNGKTYPQCGKTCRDKAQAAETEAVNVAACDTCILCWKLPKVRGNDFCSQKCALNAESRSPVLLEIPNGHTSFKKVAGCFSQSWQHPRAPCPTVKRIYMVSMKKSAKNSYELYRNKVAQHGSFPKKGNELQPAWLGIPRDCGFGDPGKLEPCSSSKCLLCCIVRSSVTRQEFVDGIMISPLHRAVEAVGTPTRRCSKVVLLADILMGRQVEIDSRDITDSMPPPGSDSVHIVNVHPHGTIDSGEVVVYNGDAVNPIYLIAYE